MSSKAIPRPGGRTAQTTQRAFDAALALLAKEGLNGCTYQAVAEHSGVARATLYRRWPTRAALVGEAIAAVLQTAAPLPDTGSFAGDLTALLTDIAAFLQSPLGRAAVAAAAEDGAETAPARMRFWQTRLAAVTPMLDRAVARKELPATVDRDALLATAIGPLYFRLLVMGEAVDAGWIARIVGRIANARATRA